jgi:pilus assembly protein CpaE
VIKVLIVDDIPETRDHLTKLLGFEQTVDVCGGAGSGEEAIQMAMDLRPDVIVMDINMPGMDGVAAAEIISQRLPTCPVIMMSVHGEAEQLKRSISAGASEFLIKPFSGDELATSIKRVYQRELARFDQVAATMPTPPASDNGAALTELGDHQVIAVFSPKGGAGRTTIATNLALALMKETGGRVCLVDGNLQFGDVGVLLNLNPKNQSMLDSVEGGELDRDPGAAGAADPGGRRPGHARLPAQDDRLPAGVA